MIKSRIDGISYRTGERPLRRPRRRWEDNIRMYFKEIGINTRNLGYSAQHRGYWRYRQGD